MSAAFDLARRSSRPAVVVADLPIETLGLAATARAFVDYCLSPARADARRPLYSTSADGNVVSLCAGDRALSRTFRLADSISADGRPIVLMSKLFSRNPLPEGVATTDLFVETAARAEQAGVSFYILGGDEEVNRRAVAEMRRRWPRLEIVGSRRGDFATEDEPAIAAEIAALKPDILWVSLGVPLEQHFCKRNLRALKGVGIVRTANGLVDLFGRAKKPAPRWMQAARLEWLFGFAEAPRRLLARAALTNPHALFVMLRTMR